MPVEVREVGRKAHALIGGERFGDGRRGNTFLIVD